MQFVALNIFILLFSFDAFCKKNQLKWEFDYKDDGVTRYRTDQSVKEMTPFKASMDMDVSYTKVMMAIANNEKSPEWSPRLIKAVIHERTKDLRYTYSQFYRAPWHLTNRQLLMKGKISKIKNGVEFKGSKSDKIKYKNDDYIQASIHRLHFTVVAKGKNKSHATVIFIGDMGGWIPSWIVDIVQESWPTNFLLSLHKRAKSKENTSSPNYQFVKKTLSLP